MSAPMSAMNARPGGSGQPPGNDADVLFAGFARALRHAGVAVTPDRTQLFLRAAAVAGAGTAAGVYWAGRASLCAGPEDLDTFDRVFDRWFAGAVPAGPPSHSRSRQVAPAALHDADGRRRPGRAEAAALPAMASRAEVLRHRDIADLGPDDRAGLSALFASLRLSPPRRRAARRRPATRGTVDAGRMLRDEIHRGGEPGPVRFRRRGTRPRRLVALIDVSGSMGPYADSLLRVGHVLARTGPPAAEVFTIGTRLTRVTRALRQRDPDVALKSAGDTVPDWSGGTRLGETLKAFLDRWGQRGMARGSVVIIFSDGWERGDCSALEQSMQRLSRLAHRVIWVNQHRGKSGYLPVQAGMAAALPYVDDFLAGHSIATFEALMGVVADA